MQRGRIKIGTIGPHERVNLGIEPHLPRHGLIPEWSIERTGEDGLEVDLPNHAIAECDSEAIWADNLKVCDSMQRVDDATSYRPEGRISAMSGGRSVPPESRPTEIIQRPESGPQVHWPHMRPSPSYWPS